MDRSARIAVVGAGLGGMVAAGLLQRAGFDVCVYEQATAFSRIGAGIHLSANVMLVLRRLGVEAALVERGLHPETFLSRRWDSGETLFELPLGEAGSERYGAPYINVHRGDLHHILHGALEPETVLFGKRLIGLAQADDFVHLEFGDGDAAVADIVIGADGVNSSVRSHLVGAAPPRFSGHIAHRAIFPASRLDGFEIAPCSKWWGADRHILVYYMTQAREEVYAVTSVPAQDWDFRHSVLPCDPAAFTACFAGWHDDLRRVIAAADDVTQWPVFDREPIGAWSAGRVVLLGDACHPLLPYMASGAAMAIEDAAVLARCIAAFDPAAAFAVYQASRMARIDTVRRISLANTWLREPVDPSWLFAYDACTVPLTQ